MAYGNPLVYENGMLVEVWYKAGNGIKIRDPPSLDDFSDIENKVNGSVILNKQLIPNGRINTKEGMMVSDLFTPRNLLALSILMRKINGMKDTKIRDFFKFCFTSCTGQTSKMVFVVNNRGKIKGNSRASGRREVGSWVIGYWIPKEHFEINVWNCFERRYRKILAAKKSYYDLGLNVSYANDLKGLENGYNVLLINKSCHKALREMPDSSVDYIITDPPHGDRVPYLELSAMWNTWMNFDANFDDELVISNAKSRQKTVEKYIEMLEDIMSEMVRVLKPGKYLTLMFNSYDNTLWKSLQKMFFKLGISLAAIDTVGYSAASVVQDSRKGGLKTDFILTFQKTVVAHTTLQKADNSLVKLLVRDYCNKHDDHAPYKILNHLIVHMVQHGLMFDMPQILSATMEQKPNVQS